MIRYVSLGLKIWDIEGFKHTEEWINMYEMFEALKSQLQNKELKSKSVGTKTDARIESKTIHGKQSQVYSDKVDMGNPKSPVIGLIRDYVANEND